MNIKNYLESFPLVSSNEGILDSVTGKSKPKPKLHAKNIKDVIRRTYKDPQWLDRFKTPSGNVTIRYSCAVDKDPEKGWREERKKTDALAKHIESEFNKVIAVCDKFGSYLTKADPKKPDEADRMAARIAHDLEQLQKTWSFTRNDDGREHPPAPKDTIPKIADFILSTKEGRDDSRYTSVMDKVNEYTGKWYSVSSKYRRLAEELQDRSNDHDDAWTVACIMIRGYLVEFAGHVDEALLTLSRQTYAESLIRYVNASLK